MDTITIDAMSYIFGYCNYGSIYKQITLVCKNWRQLAGRMYPNASVEFCNHLMTLLQLHPNAGWNWYAIPRNPSIPADFLLTNEKISGFNVSQNPNITWEHAKDKIDQESWSYNLITNPNITMDIILNNHCFAEKKYRNISQNKSITTQNILDNPNITWNYRELSSNPNLMWNFICAHNGWDWSELSANPAITWEIIRDNPNCAWSWVGILQNPNITTRILEENISTLINMGADFSHPKSYTRNLTWEFVLKYHYLPWNWAAISMHKCITWDIVMSNPRFAWDYGCISMNPNLTWKIIEECPMFDRWKISANTFEKNEWKK